VNEYTSFVSHQFQTWIGLGMELRIAGRNILAVFLGEIGTEDISDTFFF
jgi:hypothetical protein